ncbi:MAG: hypothetical protein OEN23_13155 [Paracoccaceae bacterium]|nr:hypothetical protein [Paracoccaceae bacterium]
MAVGIVLVYISRFWEFDLWSREGLFGVATLPPGGDLLARWLRGIRFWGLIPVKRPIPEIARMHLQSNIRFQNDPEQPGRGVERLQFNAYVDPCRRKSLREAGIGGHRVADAGRVGGGADLREYGPRDARVPA